MGAGSTRRGEDAGGLAAVTLGQTIIFMADAGCTIDQIVAVTRAYEQAKVDRRIQRGCAKAIAAALFPPQSPILESGIAVVKSDSGAPAETFAGVRAAPIKSAARAGILASGLRPAATRVAARLIEHHNVQTGRCDPSIARMARDLGLTGRSVRRAIDELVGALLVTRHVNRGRGHSNSYDIDLVAMSAMGLAAAPQNRTPESAKPDSGVLQNRGRKQSSSVGGERAARIPAADHQRRCCGRCRGRTADHGRYRAGGATTAELQRQQPVTGPVGRCQGCRAASSGGRYRCDPATARNRPTTHGKRRVGQGVSKGRQWQRARA